MRSRLAALMTVKSIVTIAMTTVFCVLALKGTIDGNNFLTVFTTVVAFYFGTQTERRKGAGNDDAGN